MGRQTVWSCNTFHCACVCVLWEVGEQQGIRYVSIGLLGKQMHTHMVQTRTHEHNDVVAVQHDKYGRTNKTNSLILTFNLCYFHLTFRNQSQTHDGFSQSILLCVCVFSLWLPSKVKMIHKYIKMFQ